MGQLIRDTLLNDPQVAPLIAEIRGSGLMLGIELRRDCGGLVATALENGLLINVTAGNTIRLLPPLIISAPEALELTQGVARLIRDFG
jgi:acetylornithine aminotransferase